MYELSRCNQEISQDIIDTINTLYSAPSYADLSMENVSAVMHGKYLDANLTVTNNGLRDSTNSTIKIYADDEMVKEFEVEEIEIGYGRKISLKNIFILQISVGELKFVVSYDELELNQGDNEIILNIKNKN